MSKTFPVTIYHNPACGTSRNTLALLRERGLEPEVVEYLKTGWTAAQLQTLFDRMGVSARQMLRDKSVPEDQSALLAPGVSDDAIIRAMIDLPVLVNRPIVVTPKGAVLARPEDAVLAVL